MRDTFTNFTVNRNRRTWFRFKVVIPGGVMVLPPIRGDDSKIGRITRIAIVKHRREAWLAALRSPGG